VTKNEGVEKIATMDIKKKG